MQQLQGSVMAEMMALLKDDWLEILMDKMMVYYLDQLKAHQRDTLMVL
jgi:hypothetical protein